MESKHFSHHHPLAFHNLPQGSQSPCSGCKSPASGDVYACWQCSYFLHKQCFRAARSLKHPSHPLHPLTLVPSPTHPSSSFLCNSCNLSGDAFSYTCSYCDFDLHIHCALNPNPANLHAPPSPLLSHNFNPPAYPPPQFPAYSPQNQTLIPNHPQNCTQSQFTTNNPSPIVKSTYPPNTTVPNQTQNCTPHNHNNPPLGYPQSNSNPPQPKLPQPNTIKHFSHPHTLEQIEINNSETAKICSACECKINGSAYRCTEPYCIFILHKGCFDSPCEFRHKAHPHTLTLLRATPYSTGFFTCDACRTAGKGYVYTCSACTYDLHIDCIGWPEKVTRPDHDHPLTLYYEILVASEGRGEVFTCLACRKAADPKAWVYYCKECDFGTHLGCMNSEIKPQPKPQAQSSKPEDEMLNFEMQKMSLDLQMQMAKAQAEMMISFGNSISNLV